MISKHFVIKYRQSLNEIQGPFEGHTFDAELDFIKMGVNTHGWGSWKPIAKKVASNTVYSSWQGNLGI